MLPPGPSLSAIEQTKRILKDEAGFLEECREKYGSTFAIKLVGAGNVVITASPEAVRTLFTASPYDVSAGKSNARFVRPLFGDTSVLVADSDAHVRKRRLLVPPFHGAALSLYASQISQITEDLLATIPDGDAELLPQFRLLTMRVILRVVFGVENEDRMETMSRLFRGVLQTSASRWRLLVVVFIGLDAYKWFPWLESSRLKRELDREVFAEIRARRAALRQGDVCSLLLQAKDDAGQPLSDLEVRDDLVTLLSAGYDTTATALGWIVHDLVRHPEVMAKVKAELRTVSLAGICDASRLRDLPYLEACIRESLRLHPVVFAVGRILEKPMVIGDYEVPAGIRVQPSIYLSQMDPATFPEPEQYNPDRFLNLKADPYEWFPFGGGARRCLGMTFALFEMKIVLGLLLQHLELSVEDKTPEPLVRQVVTSVPGKGALVHVQQRAWVEAANREITLPSATAL